jgi:O-antigen/teichoic acid export membrane protein
VIAARTSRAKQHLRDGLSSSTYAARPADVGAAVASEPRERSPLARGAVVLTGAMGLSGLLTYLFLVLAARTLGPTAYGEIGVLWGAMYIASIVLFRPLEQTTSRAIADRRSRGEEGRTVVRSVGLLAAALAIVVLVAGGGAWYPITHGLFGGDNAMTALLICGIVFYGGSYFVRGLLGGTMWFNGYGINVVAEGAARLVVAAPLLFFASKGLAGVAVIAAGLGGAVVPMLVGRRRIVRGLDGHAAERFRPGSALAFAAPASTIAAADQLLVNGAPLLIMVGGGAHSAKLAGVAFAATMLVRAPVYVFQGIAAALLPSFTHLQAGDRARSVWTSTLRVAKLVGAAGVAIVIGTAIAGPLASRVFYGSRFETTRGVLIWLAVGVAFYLVGATLSQTLLALDAGRAAAGAWACSALTLIVGFVALPGTPLFRVAVSFALATLVLLCLLASSLYRRIGRA